MKHILVTGCNGQLGNELQRLTAKNPIDDCHFLYTDVQELDITDRAAVRQYIEQNQVTVVVNCAAYTAVDKAEADYDFCHLLNSIAPGYLAEAVANQGGTMIQISTDYVFDGRSYLPYRETDHNAPLNVYGKTKLEGENNVIRTCPGSMVIRTAWLYSTFGNNFVKTMIRLGKEKDQLGIIYDQVGTPTYAKDLAEMILHVIREGVVPGVYHYSNEGSCSWYDFACAIHRYAGVNDCDVRPIHTEDYPVAAERPHYSVLDKTKIKQTYGFNIRWWADALKACIDNL